jgi:hypothetical protein
MATSEEALTEIKDEVRGLNDTLRVHWGMQPLPVRQTELLDRIGQNTKFFSEGRALFRTNANTMATAIAGKLNDGNQRGLCNEIPVSKLIECFKSSGGAFDRRMFNEFAGVSRGHPATVNTLTGVVTRAAAPELDTWEEVVDDKGKPIQNVRYELLAAPPAAPAPQPLGIRLNTYRPEIGIVAWSLRTAAVAAPPPVSQTFFWGYQVDKGQILWVGQELNAAFALVNKNSFLVTLQYIDSSRGARRFVNLGFTLTNSNPDPGFHVRSFENALFAELLDIMQLPAVQTLLGNLRSDCQNDAATLAPAIAEAFDSHRDMGNFTTAPLTTAELTAALRDPGQSFNFDLSDFNQFASKWDTTFRFYNRNGTLDQSKTILKKQLWMETVPAADGYYQRVTGSTETYVDPFRAKESADGLLEVILDAYLPGIGICGCTHGFNAPPPPPYSLLLAYKLPGGRFLWIAQFFDAAQIYGNRMASPMYFIALEWLETYEGKRQCHLVGDNFTITFGAAADCAVVPGTQFLKASSKL